MSVFPFREYLEIPTRTSALTGVYIREYDSGPQRLGTAEHHPEREQVVFTFPDDWLTLEDLQAMADYVDTTYGKPVQRIICRHSCRRAIILLLSNLRQNDPRIPLPFAQTQEFYAGETPVSADRDIPRRTIVMSYAKESR